jgi:hypothetical protein
MRRSLPVFHYEQTSAASVGMSQTCHFRTHALQQIATMFEAPVEELSGDVAYLLERRQVAGAVPNAFLKAREKAASEL